MAGTTDYGRDAEALMKQAAFGTERDFAERSVSHTSQQIDGCGLEGRFEAGVGIHDLYTYTCAGKHCLATLRYCCSGVKDAIKQLGWTVAREIANFEVYHALVRHNVEGCPAADGSDVHCCKRDRIVVVSWTGGKFVLNLAQETD